MNIINKLTLRHLRLNRGRTLMTVLGIVLSVAMVCCVAGFVMSMRDMLTREIKTRKGDYHVVFTGVTPETAEAIAREDYFSTSYTRDGNIYLRAKHPDNDIDTVAAALADQYGVEEWGVNTELLGLEGVFPRDDVLITVASIAVIAVAIIVVGSVIVIANAFYISSSERVRQFGLLKSAGATGGQLRRSILFEASVLALIAIPAGVVLGFLIQAAVLYLTNDLMSGFSSLNNASDISFRIVFSPAVVYISVAIAVLTVLISAWGPARRAGRISPIDAIRKAREVRIRARQLKTSRLTRALFGFEGTLAAKSLKRSRGKYRATVVSLTVSIALFIGVSSFIWVLNKGVSMEYGGYDFDVLVSARYDLDTLCELEARLLKIPDAQMQIHRRIQLDAKAPDGFYTQQAIDFGMVDSGIGREYPMVNLYAMPDDAFRELTPNAGDGLSGILVNTTGTLPHGGKLVEFAPYDCAPGTQLSLGRWDGIKFEALGGVTVAAVEDSLPDFFPAPLFNGYGVGVFVPQSQYEAFIAGQEETLLPSTNNQYAVLAADPDAFCEAAQAILAEYGSNSRESYYSVSNLAQQTQLNRNLTMIVSLFGYGFIAMLSLIAVTSVVATISTGMALRRQEFAMLFSAGMTSGGLNKMLNLESLLYGLKSILIGLPVGLMLSYLLYIAMGNIAEFPYEFPWRAMLVSAGAVMLLTFGTMRYGKRKLRKISIVEAIRSEAI